MKKLINIITISLVLIISILSINVYADSLDTIDISVDKTTVFPGQNVTVNVNFGTDLGAYTVDIAYDSNLFEYVTSEGGTENDNGTRIRIYYFDTTGGSNPRRNMSVTFKAKENILTSNPTDFSITAEGLSNADASVSYDDITTPIVKNIIVEPKYLDYNIALNYTGDILENVEKEMKIIVSSEMGKNYAHTRIIAEATSQTGGTAKLLATDSQGLEHDIIQSGWGDASGDPIGGKDVKEELNVRGLFTKAGDYTITLKLIDRDNSDNIIASKAFTVSTKTEKTDNNVTNPSNPLVPPATTEQDKGEQENNKTEKQPTILPKTGNTIYGTLIPIVVLLVVSYFSLRKKD